MARHVIKYEYNDGVKMPHPMSWCGRALVNEFAFQDAQHVALAAGGSIQPCKKCIKKIIKALEQEL
jgi:hypothetical protein